MGLRIVVETGEGVYDTTYQAIGKKTWRATSVHGKSTMSPADVLLDLARYVIAESDAEAVRRINAR